MHFDGPMSLSEALDATVDAVRTHASAVRGALFHRDGDRAWASFCALQRVLGAHMRWESEELSSVLDLDSPAGTRAVRAWHELLLGALADLETDLAERGGSPVRADRAAARLVALCEDYRTDQTRGAYRSLEDDLERHAGEAARQAALAAWSRRMGREPRRTP